MTNFRGRSARAFVPHDHTSPPEPALFKEAILNSFPRLYLFIHSLIILVEYLMAYNFVILQNGLTGMVKTECIYELFWFSCVVLSASDFNTPKLLAQSLRQKAQNSCFIVMASKAEDSKNLFKFLLEEYQPKVKRTGYVTGNFGLQELETSPNYWYLGNGVRSRIICWSMSEILAIKLATVKLVIFKGVGGIFNRGS